MKKIVLVVGHKPSSAGAFNETYNLKEFDYNDKLVAEIVDKLTMGWFFDKVEPVVVYRDTYNGLPKKINDKNPDFIISFHCNAFNKKVSGTEVLYYHTSKNGKKMAEILQKHLLKALGLKNRGVLGKTAEDRGGYLLRYTKAPCIIAEPFFIDNDSDLVCAEVNRRELVAAYTEAIEEIAGEL